MIECDSREDLLRSSTHYCAFYHVGNEEFVAVPYIVCGSSDGRT